MSVSVLALMGSAMAGHYYNADGTPHDPYHELHLPHDPPLYPTFHSVPYTSFSCEGREWGYHADTEAHCQVNKYLKLILHFYYINCL